MSKIRINELARELDVKASEVIDKLQEFGVTAPMMHTSSVDDVMAKRLRRYYQTAPLVQIACAPADVERTGRLRAALRPYEKNGEIRAVLTPPLSISDAALTIFLLSANAISEGVERPILAQVLGGKRAAVAILTKCAWRDLKGVENLPILAGDPTPLSNEPNPKFTYAGLARRIVGLVSAAGVPAEVLTMALSTEGDQLILVCEGVIRFVRIPSGETIREEKLPGLCRPAAISVDAKRVAWGTGTGRIFVYDIAAGSTTQSAFSKSEITAIAFTSEDGVLYGNSNGLFQAYPARPLAETFAPVSLIVPHEPPFFVLEGKRVGMATGSGPTWIHLNNTPITSPTPITSLAVTPFQGLLTGNENGMISRELTKSASFFQPPHRGAVRDFALFSDGRRFVSVSDDGEIRLWNLETLTLEAQWQTSGPLAFVTISHDEQTIIAAARNGALWFQKVGSPNVAPKAATPPQPQLPEGIDRLNLAYRAVLERPDYLDVLETLDEARLAEAIASNASASRTEEPNALWSAWMQTVAPEKLNAAPKATPTVS